MAVGSRITQSRVHEFAAEGAEKDVDAAPFDASLLTCLGAQCAQKSTTESSPPLTVTVLGAGEHNRVWRVRTGDKDVVVRVPKGRPHSRGFYAAEFYNQYCAHRLGLAPRIWAEDPAKGLLVSDYVCGPVVSRSDFNSENFCWTLARSLRRLHDSGQWFLYKHDFLSVTKQRVQRYLNADVVALPGTLYKMTVIAENCRRVLLQQNIALCPIHGDLALVNIIRSEQGLCFIDWEAAGMGDRLDELACVIFNAGMTPIDAVKFMNLYFHGYSISRKKDAISRTFLYWLLHVYRWAVDHEQRAQRADNPKYELHCRNVRINEFRVLLESELVQSALQNFEFYDS